MEISKVLIATIIVATLSSETLSAPLSSTPSTLQVLVTYVIPEKTTNATQEVGISWVYVYIFTDEVILLVKITWRNFLIYIDHPKLPTVNYDHCLHLWRHWWAQLVQPKLMFFFKLYPNEISSVTLEKKFKNFHFQIRNSEQFLYWKRRFHDLVIWFFKSLTLCFCLNCNQKTALAYVSKGVRFLKKSPGTNGLS